MGLLNRRSLLVTFRVSPEEHKELQVSRLNCGARSISDFVRVAALQKAHNTFATARSLSGDLMTLSEGLRELDALLVDAQNKIRAVLGPIPRASGCGAEIPSVRCESNCTE